MACRIIASGKGGFAIACGGGATRTRCGVPGCSLAGTKLCDFPVTRKGTPGTCDARLCDRHAAPAGAGKDHCPPHAARAKALAAENAKP
jgi:hypothetical protein